MSKRKVKSKEFSNKLLVFSNEKDENIQSPKIAHKMLPKLPIELIRCVASYLDDLTDIKSLTLVSKEIRTMIFGVPEVMKRIKINLHSDIKFDDALRFLKIRGKFIRNLNFEPDWGTLLRLSDVLTYVPNLEELAVNISNFSSNDVEAVISETPQLERLKLFKNFGLTAEINFMEQSSLKNLKILSIDVPEVDDKEALTNLIVRQDHLTSLKLIIASMNDPIFPSRDISQEVKFSLKSLKLSIPSTNQQIFLQFLKTQATNLEELELNCITNPRIYEFIFNNFKNLKKFTIDEDGSDVIFDTYFLDLKLESLKYFHDKNQNGTIVSKLFARFPNIETLKCCDTMEASGTFPKLTTLDVSEVYWPRIRNLKMPNLKNFFIKKIDRCDDNYYWTHFPRNFQNIENITVEKVGNETKDVLRFVKRLKIFKKLKTFKLRHGIAIDHNYKMDDNEQVQIENNFYKILVDTTTKTVMSSSHIVQNCKIIQKYLLFTFTDFKFYEFCFPEMRVRQIYYQLKGTGSWSKGQCSGFAINSFV